MVQVLVLVLILVLVVVIGLVVYFVQRTWRLPRQDTANEANNW